MSITTEQVRMVAQLARIELSSAELPGFARDLDAILNYASQLQQVNTDGVEPLTHPLELHNVFRPDEPAPSMSIDEALANAPARVKDFFVVPPALG